MATLILLNKTELPKGTPSEALVAVWDKGSVPDGQISIPVELNERLLPIRDDLAAWTYETGCARINGKLLEEHLRADDNLSMWWCSTLVEKHPKVTHNLFPALKLRALELLLDEKGVTRLELCVAAGADPWMEDVLGRFCKATGREFAVRRIGGAEAAQPGRAESQAQSLLLPPARPGEGAGALPGVAVDRAPPPAAHAAFPARPARRREAREHRDLFPQHRHGRRQERAVPLPLLGKAP